MNSSDQIDRLSKESTDLFLAFYGQLLDIDFLDELAIREKIRTRADVKRLCLRLMDRLQTERDRILVCAAQSLSENTEDASFLTGKDGLAFQEFPPFSLHIPYYLPMLPPSVCGQLTASVLLVFLLAGAVLASLADRIREPASILIHAAAVFHLGKPFVLIGILVSVILMIRAFFLHGSLEWAAADQLAALFRENDISGKFCGSIHGYWEKIKERLQE